MRRAGLRPRTYKARRIGMPLSLHTACASTRPSERRRKPRPGNAPTTWPSNDSSTRRLACPLPSGSEHGDVSTSPFVGDQRIREGYFRVPRDAALRSAWSSHGWPPRRRPRPEERAEHDEEEAAGQPSRTPTGPTTRTSQEPSRYITTGPTAKTAVPLIAPTVAPLSCGARRRRYAWRPPPNQRGRA